MTTRDEREQDWALGRELERKDAEIERLRAALEDAVDDLERIAGHALGTPGLRYPSLETLIASATGIAKRGTEDARRALA